MVLSLILCEMLEPVIGRRRLNRRCPIPV